MAEELDAPKTVLEACERLAPHYVSTRYPQSASDEYDEEVSDLALESAGKILDWVEVSS